MRSALFLFAALDDADMRWLASHGTRRDFPPGATLIRRGERLNGLLLILAGTARVDINGHTILRRAGECLGEVSLVDSRPASVTVAASEPTTALLLDGDTLRRQFAADPGFAARCYRGLAILLANRLREAAAPDSTAAYSDDTLDLDDTILDAMTRAGARFQLLLSYTNAEAGP